MRFLGCLLILMGLVFAPLTMAQDTAQTPPSEREEQALELRARDVGRSLRCVVCQNQSIEDSDAPLAADMRAIVREQIAAGQSDADIRAFMQARYGDFVLLKPPVKPSTYALWIFPFALIAFMLFLRFRPARRAALSPQLSDEERATLDAITQDQERQS